MFIQIALLISVVLQFGAFFICVRLIPKTTFNVAWISISIAFLLMAIRRLNELLLFYSNELNNSLSTINCWIAVVISIAVFIASIYIQKIFDLLNRINNLHKENEARVLKAIITTEENERRVFAKELHDSLGPILSSMKMTLSAIQTERLNNENKEILQRTEKVIDSAITTTKEISNKLNPLVLERFGLNKALNLFIENICLTQDIKIHLQINTKNKRIPYTIEVVLYRILCELINNTLKYAEATVITITVQLTNDTIYCNYIDNGKGFNDESMKAKGQGIANIKSRIKSINGSINIKTSPGKGVKVTTVIPI